MSRYRVTGGLQARLMRPSCPATDSDARLPWVFAVPTRAPLRDQLMSPVHVRRRLDGADRGNRSPAFSDCEAHARSHALQMAAQMRLQVSYPDGLHT